MQKFKFFFFKNFCNCNTRDWAQGFTHAKQVLYHLAASPARSKAFQNVLTLLLHLDKMILKSKRQAGRWMHGNPSTVLWTRSWFSAFSGLSPDLWGPPDRLHWLRFPSIYQYDGLDRLPVLTTVLCFSGSQLRAQQFSSDSQYVETLRPWWLQGSLAALQSQVLVSSAATRPAMIQGSLTPSWVLVIR